MTACGLNVLGLALMALLTWSASGAETILTGGLLFALPWSAVFVLSILAPGWTPRQRATSASLYPVTLVAVSLAVWAMASLIGPQLINVIPFLVLMGAALWTLVRLLKAALPGAPAESGLALSSSGPRRQPIRSVRETTIPSGPRT